jgi:hypothetical protein
MEWAAPRAYCTLTTTREGSAELFFSEGSRLPGDAEPGAEALRSAVAFLHERAEGLTNSFAPASQFPLPRPGAVQFWLRTDRGILAAAARESDLQTRRHRLWRLYFSAHEVTSALYELDELRYAERVTQEKPGSGS